MNYAGMDSDAFLGLAVMGELRANTNLRWTGFYLGPAPSHPEVDWMLHRADLIAQGWGLAPIYVGQEITGPGSHNANAMQGNLDGLDAAQLMTKARFPAHSTVFLDLENGPPLTPGELDYVKSWCAAVRSEFFTPGIYCSHLLAPEVAALSDDLWVFRVSTTAKHRVPGAVFSTAAPALSGYPAALMWQHDENALISAGEDSLYLVDLSTALLADPGGP